MKRISILTALVLAGASAFAQMKKADRLFDKWAFYEASKCYEKEADKNPSQEVYYKLGQCYQKMLRYDDARMAYDKVNAMGRYDNAQFYFDYGMVLKNNEEYEKAISAFNTYKSMNSYDALADIQVASCNLILEENKYNLEIPVKNVHGINNEYASFSPVLYKDGLLYVSSETNTRHKKKYAWNGEPYYDLYYAEKRSDPKEFNGGTNFDKRINHKYHDGPATFSKNFDTIYFNRVDRLLKGSEKRKYESEVNRIYTAVLDDGKWKHVEAFEYNNDSYSVATPCLSKDGSRLYFSSDMPGGYGKADLYYCTKVGDGWSTPVNLGASVNTYGNEKFPSFDMDGTLYFASDGYMGYGSLDLCVARNENGVFEQAQVLKAPINSAGDDYSVAFLEAGRSGYISSVRKDSDGDADIYHFSIDDVPCLNNLADYVIGFRCKEEPVAQVIDTLEPVEMEEAGLERIIDLRIYFDFDKSFIRPDAARTLDSVYQYMSENPGYELEITGHCDSRGSDAYNMALGTRRANSTKSYLKAKGIEETRMKTKTAGERQLTNGCKDGVFCTEPDHQRNRRAQFIFRRLLQPDRD